MFIDDDLFNNYTVMITSGNGYDYICILGCGKQVTTFRIENIIYSDTLNCPSYILIKYHAGWETYAPLIVEYCINDLKINTLELIDVYACN